MSVDIPYETDAAGNRLEAVAERREANGLPGVFADNRVTEDGSIRTVTTGTVIWWRSARASRQERYAAGMNERTITAMTNNTVW